MVTPSGRPPIYAQRHVIGAIVAHARREAPRECCGLLLGEAARIDRVVPARNAHPDPARFLIDPEDHFAAIREARRLGLAVVGAYHSHPHSAALPSETDLADADDPDLLHLILSLRAEEEPAIRAFLLCDGNFSEIPLVQLP